MPLRTRDFYFRLPQELIAQQPTERRDESRLLVLDRRTGDLSHRTFTDLPDQLARGDLIVLNDTRVIPARFFCRRRTGGRIEGLFLREQSPGEWEVMLKGASRCRAGESLSLAGADDVQLTLGANAGAGCWRLTVEPGRPAVELLEQVGLTPLPPYIRRPDASQEGLDRPRYQTVYADRPGAVAAPTAGLHFTDETFARLTARGIETTRLTLHVGAGTFLPVTADEPADHEMHAEWYDVPADAAEAISSARATGRRVIAVGTTSVRVLEAIARDQRPAGRRQPLQPATGWTDIFLYPPANFLAVDALITNFHLPQSTLLMLVAAFCSPGDTAGIATILAAYAQAVQHQYRFFSYGDAMLIL